MRSVNHLSEATLAAAVEGNLAPGERRRMLRHLAACLQCTKEWAALHTLLREANLLPPMPLQHPLEQALDWLGLIAPLPAWVWHALLFALTPLAWIALVDVASVPYLSVRRTLEVWPAALLMTTHFIWLQSRLRQLMVGLWEAGVPADEVDAFQRRYLFVFQGRRLGGGWFFLGLALVATVINWLLMPAPPPWEGLKVAVIGFYALVVTVAMYWGWLWGGRLWCGLAQLWQRHPILVEQPITAWVRRLAGGWMAVAAGSMAWHFAVEVGVPETQTAIQVWAAVIFLVLLALWGGYAVLELRLARRPGELSWVWQPAVRLTITLVLVMLTLPIVHM
ncbi:MAG: hypothetical protein FJ026_08940 [Chloroflexi bacterium]|nr:hypothetical protein [Chloroflexota bacterium]